MKAGATWRRRIRWEVKKTTPSPGSSIFAFKHGFEQIELSEKLRNLREKLWYCVRFEKKCVIAWLLSEMRESWKVCSLEFYIIRYTSSLIEHVQKVDILGFWMDHFDTLGCCDLHVMIVRGLKDLTLYQHLRKEVVSYRPAPTPPPAPHLHP